MRDLVLFGILLERIAIAEEKAVPTDLRTDPVNAMRESMGTMAVQVETIRSRGVLRARAMAACIGLVGAAAGMARAQVAPPPSPGVRPSDPPVAPDRPAPPEKPPEAGDAGATEPTAEELRLADEPVFPFDGFEFEFHLDHVGLPKPEDLFAGVAELVVTDDAVVAGPAMPEAVTRRWRIGTLNAAVAQSAGVGTEAESAKTHAAEGGEPVEGGRRISALAIRRIIDATVARMNQLGYAGVFVQTDLDDIDPETNEDLRPASRRRIKLRVFMPVVTLMRSVASGDRVPVEERIDNPLHERMVRKSPIQPTRPGDREEDRRDLLRLDFLDAYVFRLNRHPGRRVDVAVSQADETGGVALDYLVRENSPLLLFFQLSNTGTEQTNIWRERFGLIHNQLTSNDDELSLDYVTSGFDSSHAAIASYEFPFFGLERVRGRVFGQYSEFNASEVGFADETFTGDGWFAGGEIIANIFQEREVFLDLVAGARWQNIAVNNETVQVEGDDDFLLPSIGLRFERLTDEGDTLAGVSIESNLAGIAGTEPDEIERLGRLGADADFAVLRADVSHSLYLEPLFDLAGFEAGESTLAHEFAFSVRGQYSFGSRLVPNFEEVAGGFYSVRGYPESIVAGDSAVIVSAEYRFHLPRALGVEEEPGTLLGETFRFRPQQAYGRPDWDLILRAFADAGRLVNSDRTETEQDQTLFGAGVGIEFQFRRNLNVRVDWGVALEEIEDQVSEGSNRFHVAATILF